MKICRCSESGTRECTECQVKDMSPNCSWDEALEYIRDKPMPIGFIHGDIEALKKFGGKL